MAEPMTPAPLASAVRRAVDDAHADLDRMPFFVRPFVRRSFVKHTGLSFDEWSEKVGAIRADDTPAKVHARWTAVDESLALLAENFRTTPERARAHMSDPVVLGQLDAQSKARLAAVESLLEWLRG